MFSLRIHEDLCKWKAFHTRTPARAEKGLVTKLGEKHPTLTQSLVPKQYGEGTIPTHKCLEQGFGLGTAEHDILWASLEPDGEDKTESFSTGNKTFDNNAVHLSNNLEYAATAQVPQLIQKKVQDNPRHQSLSPGKPSKP